MKYVCKWCKKEIGNLETAGGGICYDFICEGCAKVDRELWKKNDLERPVNQPETLYPL